MKYYDVFTPHSPPKHPEFLVGRQDALDSLKEYLKSIGAHPIVVGPRGIGKTSLIQFILDDYNCYSQIEANTVSNFDELSRAILSNLGINIHNYITFINETEESSSERISAGIAESIDRNTARRIETKDGLSTMNITPFILKDILLRFGEESIVAIDEIENIKKTDMLPKLASFIKSCSNQARLLKQKFVFSGIGKDAHSLFGEHLSSRRNLPVIYLKKLSAKSFNVFFSNAERELNVKIPNMIKKEIIMDSEGFPYYMHQVCYHMFSIFEKSSQNHITDAHYTAGRKKASDEAFSHILDKYKFTIHKLTSLDKQILTVFVRAKNKHISLDEFVTYLNNKTKASIPQINKSLNKLENNGYVSHRKSDDKISLADPLLKPFLKTTLGIHEKREKSLPLFEYIP